MKTKRVRGFFQLWRKVISLLRLSAPSISVAVAAITIIEALLGLLVLYVIKVLVDSIGTQFAAQNDVTSINLLPVLVVTGLVFLAAAFFQSIGSILRMRQGMLVSDYVDREIHDRAISVGLRYYESPEYYDALERAR
ncbi:MAG: ABC transporter ATP-binding protein, partial [Bacteroidota bacterium]